MTSFVNPLIVRCAYCKAARGEPCPKVGAHPSRFEAAALMMGLSEAEARQVAQDELTVRIKRYRSRFASSLDAAAQEFHAAPSEPAEQAPDAVSQAGGS